jgi:hypothetical protein
MRQDVYLNFCPLFSIRVEFCFFPHLFCLVWKAVVNDELLYLTELDRLTECYECAPCGMDTCDSVSSGLGV